jgi:prepilin-type N-terminal cleavage/methylation domain-containing protein
MWTRKRPNGGGTGDDGFTLVELLLIVIILGLLASIVVFVLSGVTGTSVRSACTADARTVDVATATYVTENPLTGQVTEAQLTAPITGTLASWPTGARGAYSIVLAGDGNALVGTKDADGNSIATNDVLVKVGANYYDATTGLPNACSDA